MNATIKAIKEQVSAIVVFKVNTYEELEATYDAIRARVEKGVENMEHANQPVQIFSESEINNVYTYAIEILGDRYRSAKNDIISHARGSFEF